MSDEHNLTITNGGEAFCSCGEKMPPGNTSAQSVKNWERHREIDNLLDMVTTHAYVELKSREQLEKTVRDLLELGVNSTKIAKATTVDDKQLLSKTVIQRLGREEHVQSPRRRRRSTT